MLLQTVFLPFIIHFLLMKTEDFGSDKMGRTKPMGRDMYDHPESIKRRYAFIFQNWVSITIIQPLLELLNFGHAIHKFKMWNAKRKGNKSLLTQQQANE
jgi:hypothetical protein